MCTILNDMASISLPKKTSKMTAANNEKAYLHNPMTWLNVNDENDLNIESGEI